jgi:hypothetical protein
VSIAAPRHPLAAPPSPSPVPTGECRGEGSSSPCSSSSLDSDTEATPALLASAPVPPTNAHDDAPSPSLAPSDPQAAEDDARFPFYSAAQLSSGQFDTRYLIPDILAAGQPGGVFGSFKTLKTSLTADLLISLASGTPFLGQFAVPEPGRALCLSGESGLDALQSIAHRICAARGLTLAALDNFALSPKLPRLDSTADLEALGRIIRRKRPDCLAIDPAYLAIRGEDAHNLFAMGALLRPLAELCHETGCAILIVHHCKRTRITPGQPATLDDVAWTGFAEFAAQWLLLSRRRRFDPELGRHELWFATGGRSGHHGLWALDVDERRTDTAGVPSPGLPDFGELSRAGEGQPATSSVESGEGRLSSSGAPKRNGRIWNTMLRPTLDAEIQNDIDSAELAENQRQLRTVATNTRHRLRILEILRERPAGETQRYFREHLGLTTNRTNALLQGLAEDGLIKQAPVLKRKRWEYGYKLAAGERIPAGNEK